jgi:hypothetical protein
MDLNAPLNQRSPKAKRVFPVVARDQLPDLRKEATNGESPRRILFQNFF